MWLCLLAGLTVCSAETALGQTWVRKIETELALGYPFAVNPVNENVLYAAAGHAYLYRSRDRGKHWSKFAAPVFPAGAIKAIAISPRDTNQVVVGLEIVPGGDRILRSTDGGTTWVTTWTGTFNYFGKPFDFKFEHPDTLYTMGNDTVYRSVDFAATWEMVRKVNGLFGVWCDVEIRPDSVNTVFVGDNTSGIWKTTDGGLTWSHVYRTIGEIPSIAIDPFMPRHMIAAKYGGGGGLVESDDGGAQWHPLTTPIGSGNAWWVTFSRHDSGYVYFGSYAGWPTGPFLSRDGGNSWTRYWRAAAPVDSINAYNYALFANDSLSVLALQADGVYLLDYSPGIHALSPARDDYWRIGSVQTLVWTDSNIVSVDLSCSTDGGASWTPIAEGIPAGTERFDWNVIGTPSRSCRIRISDHNNSGVFSETDSFAIFDTALSILTPELPITWLGGTQHTLTWTSGISASLAFEYSLDSGSTWSTGGIVPSTQELLHWIVPDTATDQCFIRLVVLGDPLTRSGAVGPINIAPCDPLVFAVAGRPGWNLISLPVSVRQRAPEALFPSAASNAFSFAGGYVPVSGLEPGIGYWIKSPAAAVSGCPIKASSIHIEAGWNLIGGTSDTLTVSALSSTPEGIIVSHYYGYDEGYFSASVLLPGAGYWVKASRAGEIIIPR